MKGDNHEILSTTTAHTRLRYTSWSTLEVRPRRRRGTRQPWVGHLTVAGVSKWRWCLALLGQSARNLEAKTCASPHWIPQSSTWRWKFGTDGGGGSRAFLQVLPSAGRPACWCWFFGRTTYRRLWKHYKQRPFPERGTRTVFRMHLNRDDFIGNGFTGCRFGAREEHQQGPRERKNENLCRVLETEPRPKHSQERNASLCPLPSLTQGRGWWK